MIYIVTPSWNAVKTIERTILSVVNQAGEFELTYHIQDGGSTDGTVELVDRWKALIDGGLLPIQCRSIKFTYSSESDFGMYDAIATGFEQNLIGANDFMTWINADDILMPGALALIDKVGAEFGREQVSWIGGAVNIVRDDISITQLHRSTPTEVIASGLCDGQHWDFVQQEGVFFRKWLWDAVEAPEMLRLFKFAGDWNLWRLFAKFAKYVHFPNPLGGFRISEGQLSQVNKEAYMAEIDANVSSNERERSLHAMGDLIILNKRMLKTRFPDGVMSVIEKSALDTVRRSYKKTFGALPSRDLPPVAVLSKEQVIFTGRTKKQVPSFIEGIQLTSSGIVAPNVQHMRKIKPNEFDHFTYAKLTHWDYFETLDVSLFGERKDKDVEQLKVYQDLLVLKYIIDNIPAGSRILDVGGGQSRILSHLASTYECWNIDKLEGICNGPNDIGKPTYRLVKDYMGNFNQELPNDYFDLVFSISALEHVPQHDTSLFDKIIMDIQRVLKNGGFSLHLFDIVLKDDCFWSNKITDYIFSNVNTCNRNINIRTMKTDSDLYVMSETAYNKTWWHTIKKSYQEHGSPSSLNILWQK